MSHRTSVKLTNSFDTEAQFSNLDLSITKVIVSSKMCDKWDDLILKLLIFHFLMEILLASIPNVYIFRNVFIL